MGKSGNRVQLLNNGCYAFKRNGFFLQNLFLQTSLFDVNQHGRENGALLIILNEFKRADMICFVEIEHVYFKSWRLGVLDLL